MTMEHAPVEPVSITVYLDHDASSVSATDCVLPDDLTFEFSSTTPAQSFLITIIEDEVVERDETMFFRFDTSSLKGVIAVAPGMMLITINDNRDPYDLDGDGEVDIYDGSFTQAGTHAAFYVDSFGYGVCPSAVSPAPYKGYELMADLDFMMADDYTYHPGIAIGDALPDSIFDTWTAGSGWMPIGADDGAFMDPFYRYF